MHHPPPPPNPLCLNSLGYWRANATDTILKIGFIYNFIAFCCVYLFMSILVANGSSLSVPVLLVGVALSCSLGHTSSLLWLLFKECYLSCSEGYAPTPLTFIICGYSRTQTSACSPVGSSLCLLFPLPIFYSFVSHVFGNNLPCLCSADVSVKKQKTCNNSRSCSYSTFYS